MTFLHSFTGKELEKPLDFGLKGDISWGSFANSITSLKRGIWGTNDAQYCEGILPSSILLLFISDWWFIFLCGESSIETRIPKSTWNPLVHGFFLCFNSQEDMGHGSWNWCDCDGKRPLCKYKKKRVDQTCEPDGDDSSSMLFSSSEQHKDRRTNTCDGRWWPKRPTFDIFQLLFQSSYAVDDTIWNHSFTFIFCETHI